MLLAFGAAGVLLSALCCVLLDITKVWLLPAFVGLSVAFLAGIVLLYILLLFVISLFLRPKTPLEREHPVARWFLVETLRAVCTAARVTVRVEGAEKLPDQPFLLVSNHRSLFDPIVAVAAFPRRPLSFVAKPEILRVPLIGRFARYCGFLAIDRTDARNAVRTIHTAADQLSRGVCSMGVYPEGTRNRPQKGAPKDRPLPTLLPLHDGVLMIAQKAKAPVAVVATRGTAEVTRNFPFRRTEVTLTVCDVLPVEEVLSLRTKALSERLSSLLESALQTP